MTIHDMFALVTVNPEGGVEGIAGRTTTQPDGSKLSHPFVTSNMQMAESFAVMAQQVSDQSKRKVRLVRFERVEVLAEFEPPLIEVEEPKLIIP